MPIHAAARYIYRMSKTREFLPGSLAWRIDRRLTKLQKAATAASEEAGLSPSAIRNIYDGTSRSPRSETLQKLAPALETTFEWLSIGTGRESTSGSASEKPTDSAKPQQGEIAVGRMYVRWVAEAGNWREFDDYSDQEEPEWYLVPQRPGDPLRRFLTKIAGDSMDKARLFDGDYVVTIDWNDLDRPANDGEIVVVQQTRDGGHTIETTVKQIRVHKDRYELHPRSSNPKHKAIVVKHGDGERDGRQVTIIGLVESVYRPILGRIIE